MSRKETKLQPGLFELPKEQINGPNLVDLQPSLFDLPKARVASDDFLKANGKKNNRISTGMKRSEINKLKKNKGKRRTGDASWPNEY
jgi:hypothetical protein